MSATLLLSGWGMAATGWAAAALARRRWRRQLEAVARASHELRGPLTAVRLALEPAFRAWRLSPTRIRAIELELARAALALEDLAAAWQRPRRPTPATDDRVDLAALLADCVEAWRPAAQAAGGEVRLARVAADARVRGDRLRLAQAVGNLLANAIEHGGGTVEVCVHTEPRRVRVEVSDDGPGLPAAVAELGLTEGRISRLCSWTRIGMAPPLASPRGRGLAIAGAVARAHGGSVAAAPAARGARLVLELPSEAPT